MGGVGGFPPNIIIKKLKYSLLLFIKMLNTTTIPTQVVYSSFLHISAILSMGMFIGISMIELFLYRLREKERDESKEVEKTYCDNYQEEFAALPVRMLTDAELTNLTTKIVREQVAENVEVILTFDKTTDTFLYYTDKLKDVSYPILETVARKFVIDYDCKMIYLPAWEQVEEGQEQAEQEQADEQEQAEQEQAEQEQAEQEPKAPSVFAKFKNYNAGKGSVPNFASVITVVEQMNHFRYRGKLSDYTETQKKESNPVEKTLDYASYKKLFEKKEN